LTFHLLACFEFFASHGSSWLAFLFCRMNTMKTKEMLSSDQGVVTQKLNGCFQVQIDQEQVRCTLSKVAVSGQPKVSRGKPTGSRGGPSFDSLVVGDRVVCRSGQIIAVLPRRNQLSRCSARPMPGAHAHEQVIAANIDQVVPVFSTANPAPHWNMLDRYLVAAADRGIPARIVISKSDLLGTSVETGQPDEVEAAVAVYQRIGYPVHRVSAITGEGIPDLRAALGNCVSLLVGKSGVGKTSLLNALQPGLGLRVNTVNQVTGKGRHTTTSLEMFNLDFGGGLIDTPGVREFGLWEVPQDNLDRYFPEFDPYLGQCRFGASCRHAEEPGCAVRRAATAEIISPRRYFSYLRLFQDP
jgi:ribosome biogenesis GTPase